MELTATLFFNLTPNGNGGTHYAPDRPTDGSKWGLAYIAKLKELCQLSNNSRYSDITIYNYDFNEGYIDIDNAVLIKALSPTYLAINSGDVFHSYYKFYSVDNFILTSNGARLYITLDQWATYIADAAITNATITKTNLQLNEDGDLLYLIDNQLSNNDITITKYPLGQAVSSDNLSVYALIRKTTNTNVTVSYEENMTVEIPLSSPLNSTLFFLYTLLDMISTVYEFKNVGTASSSTVKAQVINIYVDKSGLFTRLPVEFGQEYQLHYVNGWVNCYVIKEGLIEEKYHIVNGPINYTETNIDLKLPKLTTGIELGTAGTKLKLPPFVGSLWVKFVRINTGNGFSYYLTYGDEDYDITNSFTFPIVTNQGDLTAQEKIAKWLGVIGQVAGGAFQVAAGGAGYVTGPLSIAATLANIQEKRQGTLTGSDGNGFITFSGLLKRPIPETSVEILNVYMKYSDAIIHITESLNNMGADCYYTVPNYTEFFSFLASCKTLYEADTKFILCDVAINNIPYFAAQEIKETFSEGVKIIQITVE